MNIVHEVHSSYSQVQIQVQNVFIQEIQKKLYKYRMETETLEGLYVSPFIFNSHYTIISSFVTAQVSRGMGKEKI